jgi:hypothetical protein
LGGEEDSSKPKPAGNGRVAKLANRSDIWSMTRSRGQTKMKNILETPSFQETPGKNNLKISSSKRQGLRR